jgi:hypothetical protein
MQAVAMNGIGERWYCIAMTAGLDARVASATIRTTAMPGVMRAGAGYYQVPNLCRPVPTPRCSSAGSTAGPADRHFDIVLN